MVMPDEQPVDPDFDGDIMLCPHCLAENPEDQHFCHKCATPLSSLSVIDPVGRIHAQADTCYKAITQPPSCIAILGIWILFGPTAVATVIAIFSIFHRRYPEWWMNLGEIPGWALGIISVGLVYRVMANYVTHPRRQPDAPEDDSTDNDLTIPSDEEPQ